MFDKKGVLVVERTADTDEDEMMMTVLDAGAEDMKTLDDAFEIYTDPNEFSAVREQLENGGMTFLSAEVQMVPQNTVALPDEETLTKVQKLLDMLFGMIDEAKGATFSSEKCVINRDEALDLLDEIRNKLPGELTKAQELMKSKEQYVDKANHEVRRMLDQAQDEAKRLREQAQAEAKRMLEKAQEDAKTIVSESETIQRAQRRSSEIIRQAEDRSRQLYQVANTYTEDALRRTEEAIQAALDEVRESRVRYRSASAEQMQACQEKLKADPAKPSSEE